MPTPDQGRAQGEQEPDAAAVEALMGRLLEGFVRRDAAMLDGLYTADADWTNAFGHSLTGNDAIVAYLRGLFADPNFADGRVAAEPRITVRAAGRDAVAVHAATVIEGQKTASGETLPPRRNHSLRLVARQEDGSWRIVAEMYMDARDEVTHEQRPA